MVCASHLSWLHVVCLSELMSSLRKELLCELDWNLWLCKYIYQALYELWVELEKHGVKSTPLPPLADSASVSLLPVYASVSDYL